MPLDCSNGLAVYPKASIEPINLLLDLASMQGLPPQRVSTPVQKVFSFSFHPYLLKLANTSSLISSRRFSFCGTFHTLTSSRCYRVHRLVEARTFLSELSERPSSFPFFICSPTYQFLYILLFIYYTEQIAICNIKF